MCPFLAVLRGLRPHRSDRELFQTHLVEAYLYHAAEVSLFADVAGESSA